MRVCFCFLFFILNVGEHHRICAAARTWRAGRQSWSQTSHRSWSHQSMWACFACSCLLIKFEQLNTSVLTELQSRVLSNMLRSLCHPVLPRKKPTGRKRQDAYGRGVPDSGGQCVDKSKLKSYWWKAECVSLSTTFSCVKGIPVVLHSTHLFNAWCVFVFRWGIVWRLWDSRWQPGRMATTTRYTPSASETVQQIIFGPAIWKNSDFNALKGSKG